MKTTKMGVLSIAGIGCLVAWLCISTIAMFFYPGGYDYFGRPFSALGITIVNGVPNTISLSLFTIAFLSYAAGLFLFSLILPMTFTKNPVGRRASVAGSVVGVSGVIEVVGVVFSPLDTMHAQHMALAAIFFLSFIAVALFYAGAMWRGKEYPRQVAILYIVFAILDFVFCLVSATLDPAIPEIKILQSTMQKGVAYFLFAIDVYVFWLARQMSRQDGH